MDPHRLSGVSWLTSAHSLHQSAVACRVAMAAWTSVRATASVTGAPSERVSIWAYSRMSCTSRVTEYVHANDSRSTCSPVLQTYGFMPWARARLARKFSSSRGRSVRMYIATLGWIRTMQRSPTTRW